MAAEFQWQDYVMFIIIISISTGIGLVSTIRRSKDGGITDYLLANRKLKWLPVGLSILVTFQSAILFIGVPAEVYTYGSSYLLFHVGMAVSVIIAAFVFVPVLFPLKLTSTYEYLERRFQSKVARIIGSLLGMINMSLYMGVVIFAPATAMQAVSNIPAWISILVIGATATLYTTLGGLRAVVWTDVFQFCVMFAGLLTILIQGCIIQGGLHRVWKEADNGQRIDFGSLNPDPRVRHSIWALLIGGTLTWLANIGVNQSNVQRFSSVPNMRAAKLSVLVSLPGFVIFGCLSSLVGLIVYSYFVDQGCDPIKAEIISNPNQLVPLFVIDVFQGSPGFAGLFVASMVCASLSTVSSSINGLAAMLWEDVVKWNFYRTKEETSTKIVKVFVVIFGVVGVSVAYLAMQLGGPATQIALGFFGASGGPLLGMFLLGAVCPRANWIGVCCGAIVSLLLCLWMAVGKYSIPPYPKLPSAPMNSCDIYRSNHSIYLKNHNNGDINGHESSTNRYNIGNNELKYNFDTTSSVQFNMSDEISGNTTHSETNVTILGIPNSDNSNQSVLQDFYNVSYLWYSTIGVITVFVVGILVSLITGTSGDISSEYLLKLPSCKSSKSQDTSHTVSGANSAVNTDDSNIELLSVNTNKQKQEESLQDDLASK